MAVLETLTRPEVEDFLILEASLLNEWRLEEWRALFTQDCSYLVPNMNGDPYAPPDASLYLIADDGHHLTERVKRLGKKTAHAEFPRSRTRRLISNVRFLARSPAQVKVESSFITYRAAQGVTDTFYGRHEYCIVEQAGGLRIHEKRTILDMEALRPQGRLSIIV
ncbi:MAG: aromatic-ring-hydroxylating dioxygenase subunit beta [Betaproteobacteria bacterium]